MSGWSGSSRHDAADIHAAQVAAAVRDAAVEDGAEPLVAEIISDQAYDAAYSDAVETRPWDYASGGAAFPQMA